MSVPLSFVRHQLPLIAGFGRLAVLAVGRRVLPRASNGAFALPGPQLSQRVPPRAPQLIEGFLAHLGSPVGTWDGVLPPHLFPQWTFPLVSRAIEPLPYSPLRLLNGGCRLTVNRPLPPDEAIDVTAQLTGVEDDGRLALLTVQVTTGTATAPNALEIEFRPLVRVGRRKGSDDGERREKKARPCVPADAREIGRWSLGWRDSFDFALVTGDFNPIHWVPPVARAAGFRSTLAHGFATMCRSIEALVAGDGARLGEIEVRWTKPLTLPAAIAAFVQGDQAFIGERPGGEAFMTGRFGLR
jgi:hypothetical protein